MQVLFTKFDADGSGMLDVYEFVRALMPADLTRKTWNIEAEDRRCMFVTSIVGLARSCFYFQSK